MPAESEGVQGPPTAEEIEENLQQLHHLRTYLATRGG
jgi:hypothetical protein